MARKDRVFTTETQSHSENPKPQNHKQRQKRRTEPALSLPKGVSVPHNHAST